MKQLLNGTYLLLLPLILTGCAATSSTAGGVHFSLERRTGSAFIDDQAISLKASVNLSKDNELWKTSHISLLSYNNSLLLVGQTPNATLKLKAEQLLDQIPEIQKVYNQIKIAEPVSYKQRAKDAWLTTQVKTKLITNRDIGPNRIKVISEDNVIYLMGIVTEDEAKVATEIAKNINGVDEVITVFEPFIKQQT